MSLRPRKPRLTMNAWLRFDLIRRLIAQIAPHSVLEVGCGQGGLALWLSSQFDYRGYEPDPASFRIAARRLAGERRAQVFNQMLPPEPDRTFDLIVACEVLEHIEDDRGALSSWIRWLSPGGHVLLSVPAHEDRFNESDVAVGHFRRYERAQLGFVMDAVGLKPVSLQMYGMPLGNLLESTRNLLLRRVAKRGSRE